MSISYACTDKNVRDMLSSERNFSHFFCLYEPDDNDKNKSTFNVLTT